MTPNPTNAEPRNLADLIGRAALENPGKIALIDGNRTLTWSELAQAVDRFAAGGAARSLSPGDRVGLLLPNSIEFAVGVLRCAARRSRGLASQYCVHGGGARLPA